MEFSWFLVQEGFALSAVYFLIILCFTGNVLSEDPQYAACSMPASCGKVANISYPFWIPTQQSYCGHPDFSLDCKDDQLVLQMIPDKYNVLNISYGDQSLLLVNQNWEPRICELETPMFPNRSPFSIRPDQPFLLPLDCSNNEGRDKYYYHRVNCSTNRTLLVYDGYDQSNSTNYSKFCESKAAVPILKDSGDEDEPPKPLQLLREGFLSEWSGPSGFDCTFCRQSGGVCGYNSDNSRTMCFCHDRPHKVRCDTTGNTGNSGKRRLWFIVALSAGTFTFIIALIIIFMCSNAALELLRNFLSGKWILFWKKTTNISCNVEEFLQNYGSLAPKRYRYYEIKKMTKFFKQKLGQGGYGGVFKGKLPNGREVAVKLLTQSKGNGDEFVNEVASIGRTYHVNIVTLLGFCSEGSKRALVYELMPNGSLEKCIFSRRLQKAYPLGWEKLLQISIGIAQGLDYLHRGCNMRILHFDIKPHNILLDHDFCPKISDFGLAKLCPNKDSIISMLGTRGTVGYIAPELFCRNLGGVSYKSDVYSYGMMVLEMAGGRHNFDAHVDKPSEIYFPEWVYNRIELNQDLALEDVVTDGEERIARKMIKVGLWCIQTEPPRRPSMSKVVEMLEGDIDCIEMPPKPFLSPPTSPPQESSSSSIQMFLNSDQHHIRDM